MVKRSLSEITTDIFKSTEANVKANPQPINPLYILVSIIVTFIYYKAYEYLDDLRSCSCAPKDLSILKNLEMFFIVWNILFIIINTFRYLFNRPQPIPEILIVFIYIFILWAIQLVYIYNVYTYIYRTNNCECMDHWQKYVLYFQSIIYSMFPFIIMVFLLLFGFGSTLLFIIIGFSLIYYAVQQISEQTFTYKK